MISYLTGQVMAIKADHLTLKTGPVGLKIFMPARLLAGVRMQETVDIHTNLVVREDSLTLFGFLSEEESQTFDILQSVSGVGPRTALAALDTFTPDELRSAVSDHDEKRLQRIPGIGKKSAQRMILEIGDKLGPALALPTTSGVQDDASEEVLAALVSLGWQKQQAQEAVGHFAGTGMNAADMLRAALVNLGGKRG